MSKDRSLDDFADGDDAECSPSDEDEDADTEQGKQNHRVDPATPTYRFAPDGAACDGCGEVVQRRWHDDGQFVCDDCKEW